jgi:hypothetical protein
MQLLTWTYFTDNILSTFTEYMDINTFKIGAGMHTVICWLKPRKFCLYWHTFKKQHFIFNISFLWCCSPTWAMASSFLRCLDHAQVGLVWMSDKLVTEMATWQHKMLTTHKHLCSWGIRTHNPGRKVVVHVCPRSCANGTDWLFHI